MLFLCGSDLPSRLKALRWYLLADHLYPSDISEGCFWPKSTALGQCQCWRAPVVWGHYVGLLRPGVLWAWLWAELASFIALTCWSQGLPDVPCMLICSESTSQGTWPRVNTTAAWLLCFICTEYPRWTWCDWLVFNFIMAWKQHHSV